MPPLDPSTPPPTLPDNTPIYPELPPEPQGSWLAQNRKSVILGGIAALLALAIGLTALIQRLPARRGGSNATNNQAVNSATNSPAATATTTNRPTFRRYEATITPDQDNDGLTDNEESQAGTKSDAADTDGDGLTDYDEVKVYRTDPTKQNTDGDGLTDGQEVTAGTNPGGAGPLLNLNQAIQQLNNTNQ